MIGFFILEEFIDDHWFKIREFNRDEEAVAIAYLKIYRAKYRLGRYRLVGVYYV